MHQWCGACLLSLPCSSVAPGRHGCECAVGGWVRGSGREGEGEAGGRDGHFCPRALDSRPLSQQSQKAHGAGAESACSQKRALPPVWAAVWAASRLGCRSIDGFVPMGMATSRYIATRAGDGRDQKERERRD
eukprot:359517-Chlamydomonas_euryale.AAC.22